MSTPPIATRSTSCRFELHASSENRSSGKGVSDVLPDFLNEPLYELNSVRFKVNKQGASINHQTNIRGGQARINSGNCQSFEDINLLPPEFQIDSESGDADEDSDSSLGEDFDDSSLESS